MVFERNIIPEIKSLKRFPEVQGAMPTIAEPWALDDTRSANKAMIHSRSKESNPLLDNPEHWSWPKRPICFIADPHADYQAFVASLVASGGVVTKGDGPRDFSLTKAGRKVLFIIGGDCLDKGPSNLELLRAIRHLFDLGARVKLLAGNHDVRLLMGIRAMGLERHPTTEHLFVRMGDKVIPLFKEVQAYCKGKELKKAPDEAECKRRLFPSDDWFARFPEAAADYMNAAAIERELKRMHGKFDKFESACADAGLSMRDVYAIAQECRKLFLKPKGEFAWFFRDMQLTYRSGSFLFLHAGLDDSITEVVERKGVKKLNRDFRKQIEHDLFRFYFGPLANTMRTKYRAADRPLTEAGVARIGALGIHTLVHGHINRTHGQRLALKHGLLHLEGDITLDRNSRHKEGLEGVGAGITMIRPDGHIVGISNDYPAAKVFRPGMYSQI